MSLIIGDMNNDAIDLFALLDAIAAAPGTCTAGNTLPVASCGLGRAFANIKRRDRDGINRVTLVAVDNRNACTL